MQQASAKGLTDAKKIFQGFRGLKNAHNTWGDTQNTGLGTVWCVDSVQWLRKQAAIAKTMAFRHRSMEQTALPFKPVDRSVDPRDTYLGAGIRNGVSCIEIICSINN